MNALAFAESMEKSIGANMAKLQTDCSPELIAVLERLIASVHGFEQLVSQLRSQPPGALLPEPDIIRLIGDEDAWASLMSRFDPAASPSALDYAVLWSVHAMLDKAAQFYQQAAKQTDQPHLRYLLSSMAEMHFKLRRRIDGAERVVANQVWKAVGFAPGMLAKE